MGSKPWALSFFGFGFDGLEGAVREDSCEVRTGLSRDIEPSAAERGLAMGVWPWRVAVEQTAACHHEIATQDRQKTQKPLRQGLLSV